MNNKILTLLGFASKAGRLSYGMDACVAALKQKKSHIILTAADVSSKSLKEISYTANLFNIKVIILGWNIETLSHAIGHKCGIISVNEKGFADAVLNQLHLKEEIAHDD